MAKARPIERTPLCAACTLAVPPAASRYCAACGRDRFRRGRTCDLCGRPIAGWCYCRRCALTAWLRIRATADPQNEHLDNGAAAVVRHLRQQMAWEEIMRECHAGEPD